MTIGWLFYTLAIAAAASAGALGAEAALHAAGRPTRWVWLVSLLLTVGASGAALLSPDPGSPSASPAGVGGEGATVRAGAVVTGKLPGGRPDLAAPGARLPRWPGSGVLRRPLPRWATVGSGALSLAMLVLLAGGAVGAARRRRAWPVVSIHGVDVHLSPGTGPAVTGVLRPRIVLPRRLLAASPRELRAVLAHEEEHRRAGDLRVLAVALLAVSVQPWNLPAWWQLARLRLAVESDCDRRTVRRLADMDARRYGSLLLALARDGSGAGASAGPLSAALGHPARALEARIRRLTTRGSRTGAVLGAAVAALALLAACEAPRPLAPVTETAEGRLEPGPWLPGPFDVELPEDLYGIAQAVWSGEGSASLAFRVQVGEDGSPGPVLRDAWSETATPEMMDAAGAVIRAIRVVSGEGSASGGWVPVWFHFERGALTATVVDPALYEREGLTRRAAGEARLLELMDTYRDLQGGWSARFAEAGLSFLMRGLLPGSVLVRQPGARAARVSVDRVTFPVAGEGGGP